MKFKEKIFITLFACIISFLIILVGFADEKETEPHEVYQVYLAGKKIGLIEDDQKLYNLINKEENSIKSKYHVENIYPPDDLEVKKLLTYDEEVASINEVYNVIKEKSPFTIEGYKAIIKKEDGTQKEIYFLNKDDIEKSLNNFIYAFIPQVRYNAYINDDQEDIVETGELLENIYFAEKISVKKTLLNTEETIISDANALTQYILFGTTESHKEYVVKNGENVETIAADHLLSVEEFLIANPEIKSANQLLSPGQVVNIGLINPMINLVYEKHIVTDSESLFETDVIYNSSLSVGVSYIEQKGENGIDRITSKAKIINGVIQEEVIVSSQELKPAINRVIVKGSQNTYNVTDNTIWMWPTNKPYTITSPYAARGGSFHKGVDVSGKHGSPIYSASGGIVSSVEWVPTSGGNVIKIDHQNGYFSVYAHLSKVYVQTGQVVTRGYTIGAMGKTGVVTGTHLHYEIWYGKPYRSGSYTVNPLGLYK